jgi:hypothetical protein
MVCRLFNAQAKATLVPQAPPRSSPTLTQLMHALPGCNPSVHAATATEHPSRFIVRSFFFFYQLEFVDVFFILLFVFSDVNPYFFPPFLVSFLVRVTQASTYDYSHTPLCNYYCPSD